MGLLSFIKGQLIDVIDWTDDSRDTLVWRFPDDDHEIKIVEGELFSIRDNRGSDVGSFDTISSAVAELDRALGRNRPS